jgi:RNA polymerase sigma-B factor
MAKTTATEMLRLLKVYGETGDADVRETLVLNYLPLVRRLAGRFWQSSEPQQDLFQVGAIGLLKAIDRFDPCHGTSFASIVIPHVLGEIMNYLRDHGSLLKVPRGLRRNKLMVARVSERMVASLGRWPTVPELAEACELTEAEVSATMVFTHVGNLYSLDQVVNPEAANGGVTLSESVGSDDEHFDRSLDRMSVEAALSTLPVRERTIVTLRFSRGMSQSQVAVLVEVSQAHVSRLERSALMRLRLAVESDRWQPRYRDSDTEKASPALPAAS